MKTLQRYVLLPLLLAAGFAQAQGEQLFKAKCNTCHLLDQAGTGPMLKGVMQKWNDAGEGAMLYEWVTNSDALFQSGKSTMAKAIRDFSPTNMPPQQVTKEETDAILAYIDSYVTPVPGKTPTDNPPLQITPDYAGNLTIFYWLFAFMVFLLIVILLLSNSIISFVKSDVFRQKIKERKEHTGGNVTGILLLAAALGVMAFSNTSYALEFVRTAPPGERTPWLLVETSDLYLLLAIDILLFLVILYLRSLFFTFFRMVIPKKEKAKQQRTRQLTRVLTDAVPVEDESSILMDHEYDGIRELDNNLPPWWVWGFYLTILFSILYVFHYHFLKTGDLQDAEYTKEVKQAEQDIKTYLDKMAMNVDETNVTLLSDPDALTRGKVLFSENCITCHKNNGEGDIGPNLTDNYWLYGNDIRQVFGTIKNGTPGGMPEHASKLNPVQLQQVASFVLRLPYKQGKEPQGTEIRK